MGDPAGIGAEVILKALAQISPEDGVRYLILGSGSVLERTRELISSTNISWASISQEEITKLACRQARRKERILLLDFDARTGSDFKWGEESAASGQASFAYFESAIGLATSGQISALVTGPISKKAWELAGLSWPGHTEVLANKTGAKRAVMMFVAGPLKVALVTIHIPLARVSEVLSEEDVFATIEITAKDLSRYFGLRRPRLALAGLNPHASEAGRFGREEAEILAPAVARAAAAGIHCAGPIPADTLFHRLRNNEFDAAVALYHDQALIPVKLLAFESAVNITLGLPIIRTSPAHGTAFDIAGRGVANPGSMKEALKLAVEIARRCPRPTPK
jgi:4-hydroxythreonine-4-phosphate dehydrogenase